MTGMMIIAHAPLASSLRAVAQHLFPDCASFLEALDVPSDMPVEEVERLAREMLVRVRSPEALVFTDVFGATPSNVAQRLGDGHQVRVIAGVNVPMLWRSLDHANGPVESVVRWAMTGATQGVMQVAVSRPQNQTQKPGGNDQDKHHHQQ